MKIQKSDFDAAKADFHIGAWDRPEKAIAMLEKVLKEKGLLNPDTIITVYNIGCDFSPVTVTKKD